VSLARFISDHLGDTVTAPGGIGGQCVDLTNVYLIEERRLTPLRLNARDWAKVTIANAHWVPNAASNFPSAGDIVVWHPYPPFGIGVFGHIAVAVAADDMHLITVDQDWPIGAPCSIVRHTYGGVAGWHHVS
jgi:hypothetical protein